MLEGDTVPGEGRYGFLKAVFEAGYRLCGQRWFVVGDNSPSNSPVSFQQFLYLGRIKAERLGIVVGVKAQNVKAGAEQYRLVGSAENGP